MDRLEHLVVRECEDAEEECEEVSLLGEAEYGHGTGDEQTDDVAETDTVAGVRLRGDHLSGLAAVEGPDRQQVDEAPHQVDIDEVQIQGHGGGAFHLGESAD